MKYRGIFLLAITAVVMLSVYVSGLEPERNRYHQHLEAAEKAPCTDHDESVFCTHLPLMSITLDSKLPRPFYYENGTRIDNKVEVGATVKVFDSQLENNHLSDTPIVEERALVNYRGNSSLAFDKKGYSVKFREDNLVDSKDVSLCGMVADSRWALHGPFLDRALIRNYVSYNFAGEIMEYAPEVRFCELFVDDEYMGVYLIVERINFNENGRINLTKTDPDRAATSFILLLDDGGDDPTRVLNTFFDISGKRGLSTRKYERLGITYPSSTLTEAQKEYIEDWISQFEKVLTSFDANNQAYGYKNYIDIDSFAQHFLINELLMNADAGQLSTYYVKDIRGKIKIVGWDYNNVLNNYMDIDLLETQLIYSVNAWNSYLLRDEDYVNTVIEMYYKLRETYFSEEYFYNYIDETIAYLGDAIDRNYEKWGYVFTDEHIYDENGSKRMLLPRERNFHSYEESVSNMKEVFMIRCEYLDHTIENLRARSHPSVNKQFRMDEE